MKCVIAVLVSVVLVSSVARSQAVDHPLLGHASFVVDADAKDLATVDLEGDGVPEIVVVLGGSRRVVVHRGDGTQVASVDLAFAPAHVEGLDADGDGRLDVVVTAVVTGEVQVLLGAGDGSLAPQPAFFAEPQSNTLAVGDLDGDGHVDLLLAHPNGVIGPRLEAFLGVGDGTFGPSLGSLPDPSAVLADVRPVLVDLDEDGALDVVLGTLKEVFVLGGDGAGRFTPEWSSPTGNARVCGLAAAEVTDDDHVDLVVGWNTGSVFLGFTTTVGVFAGNGSLEPDPIALLAPGLSSDDASKGGFVFVGDATADGLPDVQLVAPGATVYLRGVGGAAFEPWDLSVSVAGVAPSGLPLPAARSADVDGDGVAELVVLRRDLLAAANDPYRVLLRHVPPDGDDGALPLEAEQIPSDQSGATLLAGDLNGDGLDDPVAVTSPGLFATSVWRWLSQPDGTFNAQPALPLDVSTAQALVDVTGDGVLDLVALLQGEQSDPAAVEVLAGAGDGSFAPLLVAPLDATDYLLDFGDVDGDGSLDLVAGAYTSFGGGFQVAVGPSFDALPATPANLVALVLDDLDLDGVLDLLTLDDGAATLACASATARAASARRSTRRCHPAPTCSPRSIATVTDGPK
ncbi:MAG: VCBS repeat-containing protein [Planctomycetes bacterium]|nr:VCBS repeat-containing protein [Planctomycetota bacterium]